MNAILSNIMTLESEKSKVTFTDEQLTAAQVLVPKLIENKLVMDWGTAAKVFTGAKFRPSTIPTLTALFNAAEPGADALLVDRKGNYSESKNCPRDRHVAWRKERELISCRLVNVSELQAFIKEAVDAPEVSDEEVEADVEALLG